MALDATARGNWGCAPENYPPALALVLEGKVKLGPFVDVRPFEELPELFEAAHNHQLRRRVIAAPRKAESRRQKAEVEEITA
jgi:6-hydroxycyclohex-1-ene-1-carbonyl-CoA dehydrogenase